MPDLIDDNVAGFFADIIIIASVLAVAWWVVRRWIRPLISRFYSWLRR